MPGEPLPKGKSDPPINKRGKGALKANETPY